MSRVDRTKRTTTPGRLDPAELEVWLTYMRVRLRLSYEMGRQLKADSGITLADYDVLAALNSQASRTMTISQLAKHVGWELSRASHQINRMSQRGLVERRRSASDGRVTEVTLIDGGVEALRASTPGHFALVQRVFFAGIASDEELERFGTILEGIHAKLLETGSVSPPESD